jgi:hypothetical protein
MIEYLLLFLFLVPFPCAFAGENRDNSLLWPTDASHLITSSFAEFRDNHFHSGIDIKTWGKTGYKVYAVADGWVSRIRVSPFGYGRALYITLTDGRTVLYGHLKDFADPISQYVWNAQERDGRYSVQLFPEKDQFPIKKGQVVAFTGESGVGPPHLHFEIRTSEEELLNPLTQGIDIKDSIKPTISQIAISPLNANSTVDGVPLPRIVSTRGQNGNNQTEVRIAVRGEIGFAVKASDGADGADNMFNIYRAKLFIADSSWYETAYDHFWFGENAQIRLERDWRLFVQGKGIFTRLYRLPGNELGFEPKQMTGMVDCQRLGSSPVHFQIQVVDYAGNVAQIQGELIPEPEKNNPTTTSQIEFPGILDSLEGRVSSRPLRFDLAPSFFDDFMVVSMKPVSSLSGLPQVWIHTENWNPITIRQAPSGGWIGAVPLDLHYAGSITVYALGMTTSGDTMVGLDAWHQWAIPIGEIVTVDLPEAGFQLSFQPTSLWHPICLRADSTAFPVSGFPYLSKAWLVHPEDIPLATEVKLDWQIPPAESEEQQIGIYRWTRSDYWKILTPATYSKEGRIEANSDELGIFALIRDNVPPTLEIIHPKKKSLATKPNMEIRVSDMLSGLDADNIKMLVDDKPVIFEYDPDAQKLKYMDRRPLAPGSHHHEVEVSDRAGNHTAKHSTFQIGGGKR